MRLGAEGLEILSFLLLKSWPPVPGLNLLRRRTPLSLCVSCLQNPPAPRPLPETPVSLWLFSVPPDSPDRARGYRPLDHQTPSHLWPVQCAVRVRLGPDLVAIGWDSGWESSIGCWNLRSDSSNLSPCPFSVRPNNKNIDVDVIPVISDSHWFFFPLLTVVVTAIFPPHWSLPSTSRSTVLN